MLQHANWQTVSQRSLGSTVEFGCCILQMYCAQCWYIFAGVAGCNSNAGPCRSSLKVLFRQGCRSTAQIRHQSCLSKHCQPVLLLKTLVDLCQRPHPTLCPAQKSTTPCQLKIPCRGLGGRQRLLIKVLLPTRNALSCLRPQLQNARMGGHIRSIVPHIDME